MKLNAQNTTFLQVLARCPFMPNLRYNKVFILYSMLSLYTVQIYALLFKKKSVH